MKFPKIYKSKDVNSCILKKKKIGIVGFGNQARAQALNLRDSGMEVIIGLRINSKSRLEAEKSKFICKTIKEVVKESDIICILIPDQVMGKVYYDEIEDNLDKNKTLLFSHGYNIHYNIIKPPKFINIILVAPSGAGTELRKHYVDNKGLPGLFAINQDYDGLANNIALEYCKSIGLTTAGVVKTTFAEETETDLFGEQVVLTGSIPKLIQISYEVLIDQGYSPAISWLVCYYEVKTIIEMFHSKGFEFMNSAISDTAEYGGITRGSRIINEEVKNEMKNILDEIKSGSFYKEWKREFENKYHNLEKLRKQQKDLPIEKINKYMLKELFNFK